MAIILRTILSSKWCVFCRPDHRLQSSPPYLWLLPIGHCILILLANVCKLHYNFDFSMLYCEHKNKEDEM